MSDYTNKLAAIATKKQKLQDEEKQLIERRKQEIAQLAERCEMLGASDDLIAGIFYLAKKALKANDAKLAEWKSEGARFLKPRKNPAEAKAQPGKTTQTSITMGAYENP